MWRNAISHPNIQTCKLRDPTTASQYQWAVKVKTETVAVAVATTAGADADIANLIESAWSKLKDPLLEAATEVSGFSKNTNGNPKLGVRMKRWTKLYERSVHGPKHAVPRCRGAWQQRPRGKTRLNWHQARGKACIWLARYEPEKEEFTTVSPDSDGVFRIAKQMDHTNQAIVGENSVCNDVGELVLTDKDKLKACVWALCLAAQCRIWVAKQRAPWGPPHCWLPYQCVCDPDPQSTQ